MYRTLILSIQIDFDFGLLKSNIDNSNPFEWIQNALKRFKSILVKCSRFQSILIDSNPFGGLKKSVDISLAQSIELDVIGWKFISVHPDRFQSL